MSARAHWDQTSERDLGQGIGTRSDFESVVDQYYLEGLPRNICRRGIEKGAWSASGPTDQLVRTGGIPGQGLRGVVRAVLSEGPCGCSEIAVGERR